jgi:diguanylate cyclase (GGDEF)-like protein
MFTNTQQPQALPAADPARLVAVRSHEMPVGVPELEFDATARVAATVCGTSAAFVALIDSQRLWFKASVGIELHRLEHDLASGLRVLVQPHAVLVIEDMREHNLLCTNPIVTTVPGLRFCASAPVRDQAGQAIGAVGVLDTEVRRLSAAQLHALNDLATVVQVALQARHQAADLARQAMLDPLTGTASRRLFDQALEVEMHHAMRTGEPFTLLLLSLDGLGDIRNGFGPLAADAALREVAVRLMRQVRLGDVLSRLGGDEFAVVMRHGAESAAEVLATRVVEAVRQPLTLDSGDVVGVRVCIGIAAYSDAVESVPALLDHAETALRQARRQHDRRWNFFGRKFEAPALRLVAGSDAEPDTDTATGNNVFAAGN